MKGDYFIKVLTKTNSLLLPMRYMHSVVGKILLAYLTIVALFSSSKKPISCSPFWYGN